LSKITESSEIKKIIRASVINHRQKAVFNHRQKALYAGK
jgi:hypothetical protein